jgi:hypothetical protein
MQKTSQIQESQIYGSSSSNHRNNIESPVHSSFTANTYKHKVPPPINNLNLRSNISRVQSIEPENDHEDEESLEKESSDDEMFSSINQRDKASYNRSFEKDFYNSYSATSNVPFSVGNNSYSTIQPNLTNTSTNNGLFFQSETHLI